MKNNILNTIYITIVAIGSIATYLGIKINNIYIPIGCGVFILLAISSINVLGFWKKDIKGIRHFYKKRYELDNSWWENFFLSKNSPDEVLLMSQTNYPPFRNTKISNQIVHWVHNKGTKLKIIYLHPESKTNQMHNLAKNIKYKGADDPIKSFKSKINDSVANLKKNIIDKVKDRSLIHVRYANIYMPYSIYVINDEMVITFYGLDAEGDNQPVILIKDKNSEAYKKFHDEFYNIWRNYSVISPFENPIVKYYKNDLIDNYRYYQNLKKLKTPIPIPKQAIIFPTYKCSVGCSYCSFKDIRGGRDYNEELTIDDSRNYIRQIKDYGIKKIEISGGGEPLEYSYFIELVDFINEMNKNNDVKFGLLTNGKDLNNVDLDKLLNAFNEYIRLSRYQKIEETNNERDNWIRNIKNLIQHKLNNNSKTKISLKYLLTKENKDSFISLVKKDFEDEGLIKNIDYIRFTSDRKLDIGTIIEVENDLYNLIEITNIPNFRNIISISLTKVKYPENHRCWLSSVSFVIAPDRNVYICCNYLHDYENKKIGNLKSLNLKEIWENDLNNNKRIIIEKSNCNRNYYCNCRFAEIQNEFETALLNIDN